MVGEPGADEPGKEERKMKALVWTRTADDPKDCAGGVAELEVESFAAARELDAHSRDLGGGVRTATYHGVTVIDRGGRKHQIRARW